MSSDQFPTEIMNISNKKQTVPKSRSLLIIIYQMPTDIIYRYRLVSYEELSTLHVEEDNL